MDQNEPQRLLTRHNVELEWQVWEFPWTPPPSRPYTMKEHTIQPHENVTQLSSPPECITPVP
jgi:hypothetical protein